MERLKVGEERNVERGEITPFYGFAMASMPIKSIIRERATLGSSRGCLRCMTSSVAASIGGNSEVASALFLLPMRAP